MKQEMLAKAEELVSKIDDLPTIPVIATQVLQKISDPDVIVEDVADLMLTDQVMTARVMKMVNSPVYRPDHPISSLKHALVYLGLRHIREIALTSSFISAFEKSTGAVGVETFWEHSFGVGMVSKIIAEKIHYPDLERAYIGGILHDIGEVVLSHFMRDKFEEVIALLQGSQMKLYDAEKQIIGTTHCEIGECLARRWNFPSPYCEVIANHHTPTSAVDDPLLCAIVNISDLFCSVRGLNYGGLEWISFNLAEEDSWKILKHHSPSLASFDVERFCYELDDAIPDVSDLVASIFTNK